MRKMSLLSAWRRAYARLAMPTTVGCNDSRGIARGLATSRPQWLIHLHSNVALIKPSKPLQHECQRACMRIAHGYTYSLCTPVGLNKKIEQESMLPRCPAIGSRMWAWCVGFLPPLPQCRMVSGPCVRRPLLRCKQGCGT